MTPSCQLPISNAQPPRRARRYDSRASCVHIEQQRRGTGCVCKLIVAGLVGAAVAAGVVMVAAQVGQTQTPTLEQMRKAVADLRGGRIPRPASYDAMTADQQAFVKSVLSGPRPDISGSLGVMIASPVFADLAQKTIAYSRFAGREGYSSRAAEAV